MANLFKSELVKYIKDKDLDGLIQSLHKGVFVSKDRFQSKIRGIVVDFEWNHLDQSHRLYIHDAYHDALRIATSKDVAISLVAYKNLPIYIQVADMRVERGLFYQSYTFFGLLFCHQVCRFIQQGDEVLLDIEWRTVSSKWLRFLHRPFNSRMYKLIEKQSNEDLPLRLRRADLRSNGVHFKTDEPDYLNSNILSDMVIFPEKNLPVRHPVAHLPLNQQIKTTMGLVELFLTKAADGVSVLLGTCPHEGAVMKEEHICEGVMVCPWHARKFAPTVLQNGRGRVNIGNLELRMENDELILGLKSEKMENATEQQKPLLQ
jgi:hypothetical protein